MHCNKDRISVQLTVVLYLFVSESPEFGFFRPAMAKLGYELREKPAKKNMSATVDIQTAGRVRLLL
jgi:hypothetical protein